MKTVLIFLFFSGAFCQNANKQCKTREGHSGTCQPYASCKRAQDDNTLGIYVTFCPRSNSIVCCAVEVQSNVPRPVQGQDVRQDLQKRISERKCDEYSKNVKRVDIVHSLSTLSNKQQIAEYTCMQDIGLVTGGQKALITEFPHMAALGWRKSNDDFEFNCGGSLISENFVISAAHCQFLSNKNSSPEIVRLGVVNLKNNPSDVRIRQFIRHKNYNSETKKNDIALIQLEKSVLFTNYIRPACLNTKNDPHYFATVIGFGKTSYGSFEPSEFLLKAQVQVRDNRVCNAIYNDDQKLDSTQICAGSLKNNEDACQGDSGGPLEILSGNNICTHRIIGVTSFGTNSCGIDPAVYTNVIPFIDWIESIVWPGQ